MDRVNDLTEIVRHEVAEYAQVRGYKAKVFYVGDDKQQIYTVVVVPDDDHPFISSARVNIMARVIDDKVVIEEDVTDRPLYETLEEAGIPREQIILAYAGETPPDAKDQTLPPA
jgi:nucleotide-binding universal stress UspA family protein